jgi:hypothetical protein
MPVLNLQGGIGGGISLLELASGFVFQKKHKSQHYLIT